MDDEKKKSEPTTPPAFVCRSCKQPVDAVVERHKTMGVFVPSWTAGPCHNRRCDDYVPEQVPISSVRSDVWRKATGWSPH
ncbi:hypothetical protein [Streptomyces sp. enrichment culture]|uniref:hypothetical protein n=1 Tax=Streptomyces sp. enrichment culture TaxID=1795815 RepID=UPI003F5508D3